MKGYKGFGKGMICRGKQYAENTVFEEDSADICKSGMHFCENPFDVLGYYPFVNEKGQENDFAEVEALDDVKTDDNKKYCTKKLKIGAKLGISGLVNAFLDFTFEKIEKSKEKKDTGDRSAATNTGDRSAPRIYEIEAEEKPNSYVLDRKNPYCYATVVKKSEMRTYDFIFFTTEENAKRGLMNICTIYARQAREQAAYETKCACALEKFLCEMKAKEKGQ